MHRAPLYHDARHLRTRPHVRAESRGQPRNRTPGDRQKNVPTNSKPFLTSETSPVPKFLVGETVGSPDQAPPGQGYDRIEIRRTSETSPVPKFLVGETVGCPAKRIISEIVFDKRYVCALQFRPYALHISQPAERTMARMNKDTQLPLAEEQLAAGETAEVILGATFTAQLLTLEIGGVAIKGDKIDDNMPIAAMQENAVDDRRRMRNRVYASINSLKRRDNCAYASREFAIECFHQLTPTGKIILATVVERTA